MAFGAYPALDLSRPAVNGGAFGVSRPLIDDGLIDLTPRAWPYEAALGQAALLGEPIKTPSLRSDNPKSKSRSAKKGQAAQISPKAKNGQPPEIVLLASVFPQAEGVFSDVSPPMAGDFFSSVGRQKADASLTAHNGPAARNSQPAGDGQSYDNTQIAQNYQLSGPSLTAPYSPAERASQASQADLSRDWPAGPPPPPPAPPESGEPPVTMILQGSDPPVTVTARQMRYDQRTDRLEFFGEVRLTRGEETIEGDRAYWHDPSGSAEIAGNVRMRTPDFSAQAARATVNMDLRLAKIYDGRAFFPQRHFYVSGAILEKRGEDSVYAREGEFTTCDGDEKSWSLTAENLLINKGGMATAQGVVFKARRIPLLYLPYFTAPIKNERQTGFLTPIVANSSRDGLTAALPFFWAAREDYDLTFTPVWRSKRGLAMTLEGRYNLAAGQGIWLVTYLKDHKNKSYNFQNFGHYRRDIRDVYWLRGQNDWRFGEWDFSLDVDLVSDPTTLYAFRNDIDGFRRSQSLFSQYFGRTVNEELDPMRLSTFFAQRKTDDVLFRGTLTYVDNLYSESNLDTLQNLPSLYFGLVSRPLASASGQGDEMGRPRLSVDFRYDYFTRRSNSQSLISETGHRLSVSPSLFWHRDLLGFASLKAEGGFTYSSYVPNGHRPMEGGRLVAHGQRENSLTGELELELAATLSRVYQGGFGGAEATLHQMTPFVAFEFVEAPTQEELPYWDIFDRKLRRRTFRYGVRNSLLTKIPQKDEKGALTGYEYRPLLRFGLFSSYEFASNLKWVERAWARYYTTGYFDRGAGPFELELETSLLPNLTARLLSSVDGRTGKFTKHDLSMTVSDNRGDYLSLIYDYESPNLQQGPELGQRANQIRGDLRLELSGGWSTTVSSRFDFQSQKGLETYVNLRYQDQCYGLALVYMESDDDRRFGLIFDLFGLGSIGTTGASLANQSY
jgi:LPS-assembly protein